MRKCNFDIAYSYVRQRILSGQYRPGQALVVEPLAAAIGVSRTPIHDALRQLETDGLVTFEVRVGASVKRMGRGNSRRCARSASRSRATRPRSPRCTTPRAS